MKKFIVLLLILSMCTPFATVNAADNDDIAKAYEKTYAASSYSGMTNISFRLIPVQSADFSLLAKVGAITNSQMSLKQSSSLSADKKSRLTSLEGTLNYPRKEDEIIGFWTKTEAISDSKAKETTIIKLPENLPFLSEPFLYSKYITMSNETAFDTTTLSQKFPSNAFTNIQVGQNMAGNKTYTFQLKKDALTGISSILPIVGDIPATITVNSEGYIVAEKLTIPVIVDKNANVKIEIIINNSYFNYNIEQEITVPTITNSNSIDLESVVKAQANKDTKVLLNGSILDFADVAPKIVNDRTMVPMRKIFESLGATIEYNDATRLITAKKGDLTVLHKIGEKIINVNGSTIEMDVPSFETGGRTLVPVRFISNALGAEVSWYEPLSLVIITN